MGPLTIHLAKTPSPNNFDWTSFQTKWFKIYEAGKSPNGTWAQGILRGVFQSCSSPSPLLIFVIFRCRWFIRFFSSFQYRSRRVLTPRRTHLSPERGLDRRSRVLPSLFTNQDWWLGNRCSSTQRARRVSWSLQSHRSWYPY